MPPTNIAKIFGPTLVGYSSNDPDQHAIFTETIIQASVSTLLKIKISFISNNAMNFHVSIAGHGNVAENPSRLLGAVCQYQIERKSVRKKRSSRRIR